MSRRFELLEDLPRKAILLISRFENKVRGPADDMEDNTSIDSDLFLPLARAILNVRLGHTCDVATARNDLIANLTKCFAPGKAEDDGLPDVSGLDDMPDVDLDHPKPGDAEKIKAWEAAQEKEASQAIVQDNDSVDNAKAQKRAEKMVDHFAEKIAEVELQSDRGGKKTHRRHRNR